MLNYNPSTKLYLVKRVRLPKVFQAYREKLLARRQLREENIESKLYKLQNPDGPAGGKVTFQTGSDSASKPRSESVSNDTEPIEPTFGSNTELIASNKFRSKSDPCPGFRESPNMEEGATAASDEAEAAREAIPPGQQQASVKSAEKAGTIEKRLEEEEGIYYWVPRVRVMFAAEDPRVFANRVAHAHMSRLVSKSAIIMLSISPMGPFLAT